MFGYLNKEFYESNDEFTALLQSEGLEFDKLKLAIDETLNQFYVRTATWGLDRWETELGLSPAPLLTNQERQDRIVSKLRGFGTATIRIIKRVAESYDNGEIDVVENCPEYMIKIVFVDTRGIPSNIADLKTALRDIIPAHLYIEYQYRYNTYGDLEGYTHTFLHSFTHTQLRSSSI